MDDFVLDLSAAMQKVLQEMDISVDQFANRFVQGVMSVGANVKDDRNSIEYKDVLHAGYEPCMAHFDMDILMQKREDEDGYVKVKKWCNAIMKSNYFAFFRESERGGETSKMKQRLDNVTNMILTLLYEVRSQLSVLIGN